MWHSSDYFVEGAAYRAKNRLVNLFDRPVLVLLYHRIAVLESDPQQLAVSPANFRAHLQFLKDHFPVARFEEDWSKEGRPAVVITFDDGYADNLTEALPILEEVGVSATFFVSTGTIGTSQEFWWDELEHIVLSGLDYPERFTLTDGTFGREWPTATSAQRRTLFEEIQPLLKSVDPGRREGWLGQLRCWGQAQKGAGDGHRAMTIEELRQLSRSRWVTIGAHTVTHAALSALPLEQQRQEITESKRHLQDWLGREITVFSYPFGTRSDYTGETVRICREEGFMKAASNFPAQVHSWTDPFQIPRYVIRDWPVDLFAQQLKRFWYS